MVKVVYRWLKYDDDKLILEKPSIEINLSNGQKSPLVFEYKSTACIFHKLSDSIKDFIIFKLTSKNVTQICRSLTTCGLRRAHKKMLDHGMRVVWQVDKRKALIIVGEKDGRLTMITIKHAY